jgi:hypothetical protein
MGEKGNAADVGGVASGLSGGAGGAGGSGLDLLSGAGSTATAEARGEAGESTAEMIGGPVAKTGGELLAGAALGAATEKFEERSKRRSEAKSEAKTEAKTEVLPGRSRRGPLRRPAPRLVRPPGPPPGLRSLGTVGYGTPHRL